MVSGWCLYCVRHDLVTKCKPAGVTYSNLMGSILAVARALVAHHAVPLPASARSISRRVKPPIPLPSFDVRFCTPLEYCRVSSSPLNPDHPGLNQIGPGLDESLIRVPHLRVDGYFVSLIASEKSWRSIHCASSNKGSPPGSDLDRRANSL